MGGAASPVSCRCARGPRQALAYGDRSSGKGHHAAHVARSFMTSNARARVTEPGTHLLGLFTPPRGLLFSCILSSSWLSSSPSD